MAYFPFFIDIQNKNCLIVGGGNIALRKVEALAGFGTCITIIAPRMGQDILSIQGNIKTKERNFLESDLEDAFFVIAASDDMELNQRISELCKHRGILVNVVDVKEHCSFLFPALVKKGDLTIGITTSGKSPSISRDIRVAIDDMIPDYYENLIELLGKYRPMIKEQIASLTNRTKAFKELTYIGIKDMGMLSEENVNVIIEKYRSKS